MSRPGQRPGLARLSAGLASAGRFATRGRSSAVKQVGLIGYPVSHSLSPRMQQAAFDALGIEARYALWETQPGTLPDRIAALRSLEVLGANVTIPYKEDIVPLLDECDRV